MTTPIGLLLSLTQDAAGGGGGGGGGPEGTPIGLLLSLTQEISAAVGGDGTPIGLLLALTVTGTSAPPPAASLFNWDTADPVFYDWWRKQHERQKPESADEDDSDTEILEVRAPEPTRPLAPIRLRPEVIAGLDRATDVLEVRAIQSALNQFERDLIEKLLIQFERDVAAWRAAQADEDDLETLLMMLL